MPLATGFSYQRLQNKDNDDQHNYEEEIKKAIAHVRLRIKRTTRLKRVHIKKKVENEVPDVRKLLMPMRARVVMASMRNVMKRLIESQSHFGDLFAGNYLFMQVNPAPLKPATSPHAINGSVKRLEDGNLHCSTPRVW